MFRNFIEDREEFERLERRGSFWRCAAAISAVVAALAAICALATKLSCSMNLPNHFHFCSSVLRFVLLG